MNTADLPTKPDDLFKLFQWLDIEYTLHRHAPIFTVQEGLHLKAEIPGVHCRNLFLYDKKKRMFLVTAANETLIDLKDLESRLGCGRLSFGSKERLWEQLGIYPGAVNPFCAINDKTLAVGVVLDAMMMRAEWMNVHPLDNAMTVSIRPSGLMKFFSHTGHEPKIIDFSTQTP